MSFTLSSSSSESEDDDDRPMSRILSTAFYHQFTNGTYHAYQECWPNELHPNNYNHQFVGHPHANHSMTSHMNGFGNDSTINDTSQLLNGSRILDSSAILNETPVDFVLIKEGDKYRRVRVISPAALVQSHATPDQSLREHIKTESPPNTEPQHLVKEIPLERNDWTCLPTDPRIALPDYGYISEDQDSFPWTLPLPRLWRETLRRYEANLNQERKMSGKPKLSSSFIKDRVLQQTQRVAQRRDPRLERSSLFPQPPRQTPSTSKQHNQTVPNLKTSIFDAENSHAEDGLSDSSSTLSFSSDDASKSSNKPTHENGNLFDESSDDEILPFNTFSDRSTRASARVDLKDKRISPPKMDRNDTKNKKVLPPKVDWKNIKGNKIDTINGRKNLLLEKPPMIDKNDILNSLTDSESDGECNISPIAPIVTSPEGNDSKTLRVGVAPKKDVPIKTEAKRIDTKKPEPKKKPPPKRKVIPPIDRRGKSGQKEPAIVRANTKITKSNDASTSSAVAADDASVKPETKNTVENSESNSTCVSSKNSDISTVSAGSIEQRLSEMISPIKNNLKINTDRTDEKLTDILSQPKTNEVPNEMDTKDLSDNNSSTQSLPSPLFESITEHESENLPEYNRPPNIISDSPTDNFIEDNLHLPDSIETMLSSTVDAAVSTINSPNNELKVSNDAPDLDPLPMDIELPAEMTELPFEMRADPINNNLYLPASGQCDELCVLENIDLGDCTKDLDPSVLDAFDPNNHTERISSKKNGVKKGGRVKRPKVFIVDMEICFPQENSLQNFAMISDFEISDDDFEDDIPCKVDELSLANSNTDRNTVDKSKSDCNLCQYQAAKSWKQLTKHYVRKHPNCEIPISRLSKDQDPLKLSLNPKEPEVTKDSTGLTIKSHCPICNETYAMCSEKWLVHFIAHTGEYEFQCNKCHLAISQDLHKKCNSMNNVRITTHSFIENVLYGYVCMQCKYIQLSKDSVKDHLDRDHQQINADDTLIQEVVLLKLPSKLYLMNSADVQRVTNQDDDFIMSYDAVDCSDDDNLCIDLTLSDEGES